MVSFPDRPVLEQVETTEGTAVGRGATAVRRPPLTIRTRASDAGSGSAHVFFTEAFVSDLARYEPRNTLRSVHSYSRLSGSVGPTIPQRARRPWKGPSDAGHSSWTVGFLPGRVDRCARAPSRVSSSRVSRL